MNGGRKNSFCFREWMMRLLVVWLSPLSGSACLAAQPKNLRQMRELQDPALAFQDLAVTFIE